MDGWIDGWIDGWMDIVLNDVMVILQRLFLNILIFGLVIYLTSLLIFHNILLSQLGYGFGVDAGVCMLLRSLFRTKHSVSPDSRRDVYCWLTSESLSGNCP